MSKQNYEKLTTISIFLIVASAVLADRIPAYSWWFGGVAAVCGLGSAWIYFRYGMQKARPRETTVEHLATEQPFQSLATSKEVQNVNLLMGHGGAETHWDVHTFKGLAYKTTNVLVDLSFGKVVLVDLPKPFRVKTFAEEVVAVVKGLTTGDQPSFEFEFTAEGSLRVIPCAQRPVVFDEPERRRTIPEANEIADQILQ